MMGYCLSALAALALLVSAPAAAQSVAPPPGAAQTVPTTRVIAIGTLAADLRSAAFRAVMPNEVAKTVDLYLQGAIADWYVRRDNNGVVFILNAASVEEARAKLAPLPLVTRGWLTFELIPVGPLSPLRLLMPAAAKPTQ